MEQVKAVIFDMDGLMFDTETMYYQANKEVADRIGLDFTYDYYAKYIGISDEELHRNLYLDYEDEAKVTQLIKESSDVLFDIIKKEGLIKKTGLLELLEYLEANQIKRVVASSNIKTVVSFFLEHGNVQRYFDYFIGGDEVKRAKPDPEIFEKAWRSLGVAKEHTIILEDSMNGIRAAYDAEINVIMVPDLFQPDHEAKQKTFAIYDNLLQVKEFIAEKNSVVKL